MPVEVPQPTLRDNSRTWKQTGHIMHLPICNVINIPPPPTHTGIPRAFDTLLFPGSREFDFRTAGRGGEFDTKPRKVGNLTVEEKMLSDLADKILRS